MVQSIQHSPPKKSQGKKAGNLQFLASFSSDHSFTTGRFHVVALILPGHSRSPRPSLLHCHFLGSFSFFQCGVCLSSRTNTLQSYFIARVTGDLPMELILPHTIPHHSILDDWAKSLNYLLALTLLVVLGCLLVSQGLGLELGALIMDAKQASTVVTVTMLAFVLTGGYLVAHLEDKTG